MEALLSITSLLKKIDTTRADAHTVERCKTVERLCRQHDSARAIQIAHNAVNAATRIDSPQRATATGIAFLYLAYAHHVSDKPYFEDSLWDADAAIRWLNMDPHNALIANLIKARIAWENLNRGTPKQESRNRIVAVESYTEARLLLEFLIKDSRKRGKRQIEEDYVLAASAVNEAIRQTENSVLIEVQRSQGSPPLDTSAKILTSGELEDRLANLTLLWPEDQIPSLQIESAEPDLVQGTFAKKVRELDANIDFSATRHLSIKGKLFKVEAVDAKSRQTIHLYAGEVYFTLKVEADSQSAQAEIIYLVVRRQRHAPKGAKLRKPVVVSDVKRKRVWIENLPPRIIGGEALSEEPQVIGTIEALLLAAPANK